jgi:hypothetical protein
MSNNNNVLRTNRQLFKGPITSYQIDLKLDRIVGSRADKGRYTKINTLLKPSTKIQKSLGAQKTTVNTYRGAKY